MDTHKEVKTAYQACDKDGGATLLLVIMMMIRVHREVYAFVGNAHFFIFFKYMTKMVELL